MSRAPLPDDSLLSIADISRHFSLPESTTRYYCKRFAAFIPSVGEGRRRRYRKETLEVVAAILEEMQKSRTAAAVEIALESRFPRNALALNNEHECAPVASPAQSLLSAGAIHLLERQTHALELIAELMRLFLERVPAQAEAPSDLGQQQARLRADLDTLRLLLQNSEKTQQEDLEQLRTWMQRLVRQRGEAQQDSPT
ncbi:MAG: MerR family transcriptional regulator, partial [Desulfovibrio sp.]|nr:MerR family transcriptional regulator [Desulfovibrio sp.]